MALPRLLLLLHKTRKTEVLKSQQTCHLERHVTDHLGRGHNVKIPIFMSSKLIKSEAYLNIHPISAICILYVNGSRGHHVFSFPDLQGFQHNGTCLGECHSHKFERMCSQIKIIIKQNWLKHQSCKFLWVPASRPERREVERWGHDAKMEN